VKHREDRLAPEDARKIALSVRGHVLDQHPRDAGIQRDVRNEFLEHGDAAGGGARSGNGRGGAFLLLLRLAAEGSSPPALSPISPQSPPSIWRAYRSKGTLTRMR